jgi:hypothetical protein
MAARYEVRQSVRYSHLHQVYDTMHRSSCLHLEAVNKGDAQKACNALNRTYDSLMIAAHAKALHGAGKSRS